MRLSKGMDHEASSHKPWNLILPIQIKQITVNQSSYVFRAVSPLQSPP